MIIIYSIQIDISMFGGKKNVSIKKCLFVKSVN